MVTAGRHPKNPINKAIKALHGERFEVEEIHKGHRWGSVRRLSCGRGDLDLVDAQGSRK